MPKLALAAAISQGAQSFIQGITQGRAYDQQQKLLENQGAITAIQYLLQDENTPLRVKFHALDSLPKLMGHPVKIPLTQQFGLQQFLDQDVETQPQKNEIVPRQSGQAPNIQEASQSQAGELTTSTISGGTADTPAYIQVTAPQTVKRGDLSPNEYKALIVRKNQELSEEATLARQQRLAETNFNLQEQSYRRLGYNQVAFEGLDQDGTFTQVLRNSAGDTKINKMPPGLKPLKLTIAELNANKPSSFIKEREDYWTGQINPVTKQPYTNEEANSLALRDANTKFSADITFKTGQGTRQQQVITGTQPITPEQVESNQRAEEQIRIGRQRELDDADAKFTEYSSQATSLGQQKQAQWEHFNGVKAELASLKSSLDLTDDDDRKTIAAKQKEYDIEYQKAQNLEKQYQTAASNAQLYAKKKAAAESRLSTGTSTTSQRFTQEQKAKITFARKKNPDATKNMSDDEIWQQIQAYLNSKR